MKGNFYCLSDIDSIVITTSNLCLLLKLLGAKIEKNLPIFAPYKSANFAFPVQGRKNGTGYAPIYKCQNNLFLRLNIGTSQGKGLA